MSAINQNTHRRLVYTLLLVCLVLATALLLVAAKVRQNSQVRWVSFHPSVLWLDTQIPVRQGKPIRIVANGVFNLSGQYTSRMLTQSHIPVYRWGNLVIEDLGRPIESQAKTDALEPLLLHQSHDIEEAKPGHLLVGIAPQGFELQFCSTGIANLDEVQQVEVVKTEGGKSFTYVPKVDGYLRFSINDGILSSVDAARYHAFMKVPSTLDTEHPEDQEMSAEEKWEHIQKRQLWDAWYRDNYGSITIGIFGTGSVPAH